MKQNHNRRQHRVALGLFCVFSLFETESYAAPAEIASQPSKCRRSATSLFNSWKGSSCSSFSRLHTNFADVAADHSVAIRKVTVIAVDLPGIVDSSIPADNKADMITAANQIHDLVRSLKIDKARAVGHDIGLMVAYAYAAQFPGETEKLACRDCLRHGAERSGSGRNQVAQTCKVP